MELKIHDQEIRLQKLWKSRKLFKLNQSLKTTAGKRVEVLYCGTENLDSGPDFKDAIIKLDGALLKGDIEVHLDARGWYAHQHHHDPAYNNVILHVISKKSKEEMFIEREDGVKVHQVYVNIANDSTGLQKTSQTGSEEKRESFSIVEDCPLSQTDEIKILTTIHVAGERRLQEKVAQLQEDLIHASWEQLIYKKIFEALGYSKNQIPFRKLSEVAPYEMVCSEMQWVSEEMALKKCAALLFGAAGLLPSQSKNSEIKLNAESLDYIAPLEYLWDQMSHRLEIKPMKPYEWQFFRLRPQNFPTRRLAGMAQLLLKFYKQGFLTGFEKIFSGNIRDYNRLASELESNLLIKAEGFWTQHYRLDESLDNRVERKDAGLIGKDKARDIIVNTVIPVIYLYSCETKDGFLKNSVRELFGRFPKLAENSITRGMRQQLGKPKQIKSSSQQQGLIYLHKLYCKPLRCSDCLGFTQETKSP